MELSLFSDPIHKPTLGLIVEHDDKLGLVDSLAYPIHNNPVIF